MFYYLTSRSFPETPPQLVMFLSSNNHNDSFPFVLPLPPSALCTNFSERGLPAFLPPLVFSYPPAQFPLGSPYSSCPGG